MTTTAPDAPWDIIHTYTRAQAIEDGVLVDLRQGDLGALAADLGYKLPIACTAAVWHECIALTPAAEAACNDLTGRLWDVLWMALCAIRRARDIDRVTFELYVVRDEPRPTLTELVMVCGPGDGAEPVLTISFPEED